MEKCVAHKMPYMSTKTPKLEQEPLRFKRNAAHPRKRTNLSIDPETFMDAQEMCYSWGISVSELVNQKLSEEVTKWRASRSLARRSNTH